jgi:cellulose biosynthesis protein BcsQ
VTQSDVTLVLVHQAVTNFSTRLLKELVEARGHTARVVVAIVSMRDGDLFDACRAAGALVFDTPVRLDVFERLNDHFEDAHAKASQRMALGQAMPSPEVPEITPTFSPGLPGMGRRHMLPITIWGSKGGVGKSTLAMELAYTLANIAQRTVLLVDGDMTRGYIASALGEGANQFALGAGEHSQAGARNIASLATAFMNSGAMPNLLSYVYPYPPAFGKDGSGRTNLHILFGLAKMSQNTLPGLTDNAAKFLDALLRKTGNEYEFVIFDIGPTVGIHLHGEAIRAATELIVVTTPVVPSTYPTKQGLDEMTSYGLVDSEMNKAWLVINKWSPDSGIQESVFPDFMGIKLKATIPVVAQPLLDRIVNEGHFLMEEFLNPTMKDSKEALLPLAVQIVALAEHFQAGTIHMASEYFPKKKGGEPSKPKKKGRLLGRGAD